jgi:hypothetical protein
VLAGNQGQMHAERGFRFLKDPQFFGSSLSLTKPERIMALFMVMTVCLLVYAALEYRIRKALKDHDATFPDQTGKPLQNPTARWVFHYFVGIHVLCQAGQRPIVLNLTKYSSSKKSIQIPSSFPVIYWLWRQPSPSDIGYLIVTRCTKKHQHLLHLLGQPYMRLYDVNTSVRNQAAKPVMVP